MVEDVAQVFSVVRHTATSADIAGALKLFFFNTQRSLSNFFNGSRSPLKINTNKHEATRWFFIVLM